MDDVFWTATFCGMFVTALGYIVGYRRGKRRGEEKCREEIDKYERITRPPELPVHKGNTNTEQPGSRVVQGRYRHHRRWNRR